jgi:lysozyme
MNISKKGLAFIAKEEGCRLNAYTATDTERAKGIWTIGYGSTFYEDGSKVKQGDKITQERAEQLLANIAKQFVNGVNKGLKRAVNQNQFDAMVSLAFNIGVAGFLGSTVLRLVNNFPCDPAIRQAFEMWKNAGGKPILLKRRQREADLYFS